MPILSFLLLHGRCRHCGRALPRRLLEAEVAGLALLAAAAVLARSAAEAVAAAAFLTLLLALALADLRAFRLPGPLLLALPVAGLALALAGAGAEGRAAAAAAGASAAGAAAGAGAFWALGAAYRRLRGREGLGGGDVWLMGGIGAGLGAAALPLVALVGATAGLACAALRGRRLRAAARLPFGAFLALAAAAVWALAAGGVIPPPAPGA
ncbi:MAG: prepilin peptidase [Rhodobacteraceae bacterium]|nr:prepilin peptidase [Paracoccaceae bacterium]